MGRDFRTLVKDEPFLSQALLDDFAIHKRLPDCLLQNREEFIRLCEWIEAEGIRSYLEIGLWTGRTLSLLHRIFQFETVAACDPMSALYHGYNMCLPKETKILPGFSQSIEYMGWRHALGPIDLVLIDGDHSYAGVRRDFEINQRYPHRYLMFHDITGVSPDTEGVRQLWQELSGRKLEIILPSPADGLELSPTGIGIWSRD
ncbi:MAG: class I SAM-dependent methyltransferase [Candidatus Sericytochromatia bacterium]